VWSWWELNLTNFFKTFLFKKPNQIQLAGNIVWPYGVCLCHGILGGWGQDQLPTIG
jgi:hypothetical protein